MNKLTFALISATMLSTLAKADFYVGAQLGNAFNEGKKVQTDNTYSTLLASGAGPNIVGGLIMGYDYMSDSDLYLALEGNLAYHNLNKITQSQTPLQNQGNTITTKTKFNNHLLYGISAQFGYKLDQYMIPFVSIGGMGGQYKITNNSVETTNGSTTSQTLSSKKSIFTISPGLGFKYNTDQWLASVKYEYFIIPELKIIESGTPVTHKLREHIVTASIAYRF